MSAGPRSPCRGRGVRGDGVGGLPETHLRDCQPLRQRIVADHPGDRLRIETPGTAQEVVVNDGNVPEKDMTNNIFKVNPGAK